MPGSQSEWAFSGDPPIATRDRGRRASGRGWEEELGCRAFQSSRNWLSSLSDLYLPIDFERHWRFPLNLLVLISLGLDEMPCLPSRSTNESKKNETVFACALLTQRCQTYNNPPPPIPPKPNISSPNNPKLHPLPHPRIKNIYSSYPQPTIITHYYNYLFSLGLPVELLGKSRSPKGV